MSDASRVDNCEKDSYARGAPKKGRPVTVELSALYFMTAILDVTVEPFTLALTK